MKVLIICRGGDGREEFDFKFKKVFVYEQMQQLKLLGVVYDIFLIEGKGKISYFKNFLKYKKVIKRNNYNIVHAHYGLSGLFAVLQSKVPVVISFIGTDINDRIIQLFSKVSMRFSRYNIFVSNRLKEQVKKFSRLDKVIPYGVDFSIFYPMDKKEAKRKLGLDIDKNYCLFPASKDRKVKNFELARQGIEKVDNFNISILELGQGVSRESINLFFNSCDFVLFTSFSEGSPQVIKEAMACNCPIVSTDVGDVSDIIYDTEGCYITTHNPKDVAEKVEKVLQFGKRTDGRKKVKHFDNRMVAKKIIEIYNSII